VLEVVKGCQLELVQTPFQIAPVLSKASSLQEWQTMQAEIQVLQVKQAIVEVEPVMGQFTSRLFVIPNKGRLTAPSDKLEASESLLEEPPLQN